MKDERGEKSSLASSFILHPSSFILHRAMARYGTKKYGSFKYGTDSTITTIQWGVLIDWDGDGYHAGDNEAEQMIDLSVTRGRDSYIGPNGQGLERYRPGEAILIFDNSNGRYDPYNTASPLYPNVKPGRLVDIRLRNATDTWRMIMRGKITDIQAYRSGGHETVAITVKDGLQFLSDQTLTVGLQGDEADDIVREQILPQAGWPDIVDRGWPISSGSSTKLIQQWAIRNQSALAAVHELEDVELGQFVHQRDGFGRFISSIFSYDSTITITGAECLRDILIPSPWEVVRNQIIIKVYPRRYQTVNTTVFDLDFPTAIAAGETLRLDCEFTYAGGPTIGQFATYAFTANTLSGGGGTDITASCVLVEDPNPGYGAIVEITNNSGLAGFVIDLTIDVVNVSYVVNPVVVQVEDTTSQEAYGKRTLVIDTPIMADVTYAKLCAAWLLEHLKDPLIWPTIQVENRADLQWPPYLYVTRIKLEIPTKGIDAYYRIGKIEHKWIRSNGQAVRTTFGLEPYFEPFTG